MDTRRLAEKYQTILAEYVREGEERTLNDGYELARSAMRAGVSVLELADVHHRALASALDAGDDMTRVLTRAVDLFVACLSPFEMSHRGAQEGTRALRMLNEVLEGEIKRIAHALHDEAGQLLASVHIAIAEISEQSAPEVQSRFSEVAGLLRQIELELRNLSHELRPTVLDNLGLRPALEMFAEKVSRRTGLAVSVTGEKLERFPTQVETALYRIVQEALNNAAKHAYARSVRINLKRTPTGISCSVADDGIGMKKPTRELPGLGLIGIRERLNALGGTLQVMAGEPHGGTTLIADIPIDGA